MTEQTFIGAAKLLDEFDDGPGELRRLVTSPKGTTERAIGVLQEVRLDRVFEAAMRAAIDRARELARG